MFGNPPQTPRLAAEVARPSTSQPLKTQDPRTFLGALRYPEPPKRFTFQFMVGWKKPPKKVNLSIYSRILEAQRKVNLSIYGRIL